MKRYAVTIVAKDGAGNVVRFTEVVEYPDLDPRSSLSCVSENLREAKGVEQVRRRNPHLTDMKAESSISI